MSPTAITPDQFSTFGELLRHLRRQARLTQRELAIAVGYSDTQISRMEQNQRVPDAATITALFVPALYIEDQPKWVARLLQLAKAAQVGGITTTDDRLIPTTPNNLPHQLTSFIGREKELADVKQLLHAAPLLMLLGPGGTGKTRLSIRAASGLLDQYPNGVWLVELAPILDPLLVPRTTAIAIGLRDEPQRPVIDMLCDYLREKKILIILDNCEHLVDACAQMADRLLHAAPNARILASSREPLGIAGEVTYQVPSLELPDLEDLPSIESLSQYEAVKLFIDRATAAVSTFTVTNDDAPALAQICHRLDGIPLAIELAAAKVRVLSLEQIAQRLDDRFRLLTGGSRTALERHQTLRATIDWSYNLLSPAEQTLFRRLSIFVGGWILEAAESVCCDVATPSGTPFGDDIRSEDVLDLLEHLINKSLVVKEEMGHASRYRMLETIRQYAYEKLFESGEGEKVHDQHLRAFIELAERAEPEVRGHNQVLWLNRLDEEVENMRAALEWSRERDKGSFLRLASNLWRFWDLRSYIEDCEWLAKALASTEGVRTVTRAMALAHAIWVGNNLGDGRRAGWLEEAVLLSRELNDKPALAMILGLQASWEFGRYNSEAGLALNEEALALSREIGDHWLVGWLYTASGVDALSARNDLTSARSLLEAGLKESRLAGDKRLIAYGSTQLGEIALAQGDAKEAEGYYQEALINVQEINDKGNVINCLSDLNDVFVFLEDYGRAEQLALEAYRLSKESNDRTKSCIALWDLGTINWAQGDLLPCAEKFGEALTVAKQIGDPRFTAYSLHLLGISSRLQGNFAEAKDKIAEAIKIYRDESDKAGYFLSLEQMGILAIDQGEARRGARLLGARETLRASVFVEDYFPFMVRERESRIVIAREALGEEDFNKVWAEGKAMTIEEAVAYALRED